MLPAFLFGSIVNKPSTKSAAAEWLDQQAKHYLGYDSEGLNAAQLRVMRELASKVVSRCYAEEWMLNQGITPPPYNTPAWNDLHEAYLRSDD